MAFESRRMTPTSRTGSSPQGVQGQEPRGLVFATRVEIDFDALVGQLQKPEQKAYLVAITGKLVVIQSLITADAPARPRRAVMRAL